MSKKQAQAIVNEVYNELGISLVAHQNNDLSYLRDKIEELLDLEVDTEDLRDPEEPNDEYEPNILSAEDEENYEL